jgi:dynein light chain Tctex-type 1
MSSALKGLQSLNRPYKYAITVIIMQKNGAGLVSATSTYWDRSKDGLCKVVWENSTMHCVVTVYGTSVNIDSEDAQRPDATV